MHKPFSLLVFAAALASAPALSGCIVGGCGGADFEAGETEASVYLTDKITDATIIEPTFSVDGTPAEATCGEVDAVDSTRCISEILVLTKGVHTITVSAAGYRAQSVEIDTTLVSSVHVAVQLEPVQE